MIWINYVDKCGYFNVCDRYRRIMKEKIHDSKTIIEQSKN